MITIAGITEAAAVITEEETLDFSLDGLAS
jgi:hypothetical protein